MKNGIFAAINIGTSAFRMEIGSFVNGEYKELEYLIKSLSLGKDTFSKGYISSESIESAYKILKNFKLKMDEYNIKNRFIAIATSGVREAKNREFFIDYMLKKAHIPIKILTPHEELYIRYTGIKNEFHNFKHLERGGIALINVSSGNVSIAIVKNRSIIYADSLHFGSLRLNEMFKNIDDKHKIYAYDRYIDNMLDNIRNILSKTKIKNLVFSGSSINILNKIINPKDNVLTKQDIFDIFDEIYNKDSNYIKNKLSIRDNEAEVLKSMMAVYKGILTLFKLDKFYFSKTTYPRKLIMYYSKSYKYCNLNSYLEGTILNIGEKYGFDKNHALNVRDNAMILFEHLRDIHLLDNKYKRLLEIAALLHDVGYFINANTHEKHSYYIIRSIHLPQIDDNDNKIIALAALMHKAKEIDPYLKLYDYIGEEDMFILTKLAAILRIADALDASHRQLIEEFDIECGFSKIVIKAKSPNFLYFEEMSFARKSELFKKTFGIDIQLEHSIG
jgi:exopolyphosphatase/guanosine-5'-triphosphate,3'-diphosphate pyrophosphatase